MGNRAVSKFQATLNDIVYNGVRMCVSYCVAYLSCEVRNNEMFPDFNNNIQKF